MTKLRSCVQSKISHLGRAMRSCDWLYMVIDPDPAAHMTANSLQNYMTEAGERRLKESDWEMV